MSIQSSDESLLYYKYHTQAKNIKYFGYYFNSNVTKVNFIFEAYGPTSGFRRVFIGTKQFPDVEKPATYSWNCNNGFYCAIEVKYSPL